MCGNGYQTILEDGGKSEPGLVPDSLSLGIFKSSELFVSNVITMYQIFKNLICEFGVRVKEWFGGYARLGNGSPTKSTPIPSTHFQSNQDDDLRRFLRQKFYWARPPENVRKRLLLAASQLIE